MAVSACRFCMEGQLKADIDLLLAQANASEANVSLIAAQNEVRSAFASLNNAMGETGLTEYALAPLDASMPSAPQAVEQAIALALAQRPELTSASGQRLAANQILPARTRRIYGDPERIVWEGRDRRHGSRQSDPECPCASDTMVPSNPVA